VGSNLNQNQRDQSMECLLPIKKFMVQQSVRRIMLMVLWDTNVLLLISFKKQTVTSSTNCEIRFADIIPVSCPRVTFLQQENGRPHTTHNRGSALPSSSVRSSHACHLAQTLAHQTATCVGPERRSEVANTSSGTRVSRRMFEFDDAPILVFYAASIRKLILIWDKCIALLGDYVDK